MLNLKSFLLEGGNLPFLINPKKPTEGTRVADSIKISRRDKERPEFQDFFKSLDDAFEKTHGHNLYGNALRNNSHYAGSSALYANPEVSSDDLKDSGDMDSQIPKGYKGKLEDFLKVGQKYGKFTVVHSTKGKNQTHAIIKHKDSGEHHQIDFEPVDYDEDKQEPTPGEKLLHNTHIDDAKQGLKGVYHKLLMQAILHGHSFPAIISSMKGRGKARAEVQEEGSVPKHTLSVDNGVRKKYRQIGEKDGKPIVKEIPTSESEYSKDVPTIYRALFRRDPSAKDLEDMHSFGGLINHIKEHIPEEKHGKIFRTFAKKLWSKDSQAVALNPSSDREIKERAYNVLAGHFPEQHNAHKDEIEELKNEYYAPGQKRFSGEIRPDKPSQDSGTIPKISEAILPRIKRIFQ